MKKRPVHLYTAPDLAGIAIKFRRIDPRVFEECIGNCKEIASRLTEVRNQLSFVFMVDFTTQQYLHMGSGVENMMGYRPDNFYREGLKFAFDITHPDDLVLLKRLHGSLFNYYHATPISRRKDLKFAFNLRVRKADGNYIHILQQTIYPGVSDAGEPLFDFSTVSDITAFKKDNTLTLLISELNADGVYEQKYKEDFFAADPRFTPRQTQIIDLIAKGYTTNQIAAQLHISADTVKNHRKKILHVSGRKKFVEVIGSRDR